MARLRGETNRTLSNAASLRLRACWLYYNQKLTQKQVADRLGISRATVMRMLEEAQRRNEVQIWISEGIDECIGLAIELEKAFGLDEAVVVPTSEISDVPAQAVGAALGRFLSETVSEGMRLGVGWGRTLTASLATFMPLRRDGVKVVSLLGGLIHPQHRNPVEYSWRLASLMDSECYFFLAPLIVDSIETKRTLIERCGLDQLVEIAESLDVAVVSCGSITMEGASLARDFISPQEREEIIAQGGVCDVMCNFLDADGQTIAHPVNERVMSVDLDTVGRAAHVVLATGGAERAQAIRATIRRLGVNTLITDEGAARSLLERFASTA